MTIGVNETSASGPIFLAWFMKANEFVFDLALPQLKIVPMLDFGRAPNLSHPF